MRFKRLAVSVALIMAVVFSLCGCAYGEDNGLIVVGGAAGTKATQRITFYGYESDNVNLLPLENSLRSFISKNSGYNVFYEGVNTGDYWSALDRRSGADVLDDVFMVNTDYALELIGDGKLADLSGIVDKTMFSDAVQRQIVQPDGKIYYVPMCVTTYGLYVNEALLKEHNQSIPTNLAEFTAVCNYFKEDGITPIVANVSMSMNVLVMAGGMLPVYESGDATELVQEFNADPQKVYPYIEDGLELVASLIDNGWIDCEEALTTAENKDGLGLFGEGQRPFMVADSSAATNLDVIYPKLKYSVHALPVLEDKSVLVAGIGHCISVKADSKVLGGAKKLVSHLMDKSFLNEYGLTQRGYAPVNNPKYPTNKSVAPLNDYIKNGPTVLNCDYRLGFKLETSITASAKMLLSGETLDTVKHWVSNTLKFERSVK